MTIQSRLLQDALTEYEKDILDSGKADSKLCDVDNGQFWGTLQGKKIVLMDIKASTRNYARVYVITACLTCTLVLALIGCIVATQITRLSSMPLIIVGASLLITGIVSVATNRKMKSQVKQTLALEAQESVFLGMTPPYVIQGVAQPSIVFKDEVLINERAQIVFDLLKGESHFPFLSKDSPTLAFLKKHHPHLSFTQT